MMGVVTAVIIAAAWYADRVKRISRVSGHAKAVWNAVAAASVSSVPTAAIDSILIMSAATARYARIAGASAAGAVAATATAGIKQSLWEGGGQ